MTESKNGGGYARRTFKRKRGDSIKAIDSEGQARASVSLLKKVKKGLDEPFEAVVFDKLFWKPRKAVDRQVS